MPSVAKLQSYKRESGPWGAAGSRGQATWGAATWEEFGPGACAVGGFGEVSDVECEGGGWFRESQLRALRCLWRW